MPERWRLVKELFHAAIEREPHERAAFLAGACGGDAAIHAEVERLLGAHEQASSFIEPSPVAEDGVASGRSSPSWTGRTIGRYEVGRLVGAGGMGEVYAASDPELGRPVALKVCIATGTEAHARLKREAQHASRLNHPNICTIHEVGRFEDQPFLVMELVEGQRLADLVPADGLPAEDVVRYGVQIADALAHAHGKGVLHRDLKSENVIITPDGRPKVLDFGLARSVTDRTLKDLSRSRDSLTAEGQVAGTLSVMAPEVLRGERADERSDIWAFGVLLYEMACGARPFRGATGFELSAAILHEPPPPLSDRVGPPVARIVHRCLEKDPRNRYQSAADVGAALKDARSEPEAPRRAGGKVFSKLALAAALAAVLGIASYGLWSRRDAGPAAVGASGRPAIAVMHFENAGAQDPDTAWLSSGVPSMLMTALAQTRGLEIVSERRLHQALRQNGGTSLAALDRAQAADVARRAGAGAIVVGSVFRAGREIRIDAQIEDLASGRVLGAESVRGTDVFALMDELSADIREVVGFGDAQGVRNVATVSSTSLEAYRLYSEGNDAFGNARWNDAESLYTAAVAVDPLFAEAYLRLATVSNAQGQKTARTEYLRLALQHADRLSERARLLLDIQLARERGDIGTATRVLDDVIQTFPDTEEAYPLAWNLYRPDVGPAQNVSKVLALTAAGVAALPMSTHTRNAHGYALLNAGRYADAVAQFDVYARLAPREPNPSDSLGDAYLRMGHVDKALEAYSRAMTIDPTFPSHNSRAWCLAMLGRYDEALAEPIDLMHYKAILLSRVGRYREAVQAIADGERQAKAAGDRRREGELRLVAALLALERNDPERALRDVRTAVATLEGQQTDLDRRARVAAALLTGLAHLRAGRLPPALSAFEAQARDYRGATQVERTWRHALEAEIALSRRDLQQAAAAFSGAEPSMRGLDTVFALASVMLNVLPSRDGPARVALARGDLDGAISIYRTLLTYTPESKWIAPMEPLYVLQIARLQEKKGDRKLALTEYRRFLHLWKGADAELPELAEARKAVRRLGA